MRVRVRVRVRVRLVSAYFHHFCLCERLFFSFQFYVDYCIHKSCIESVTKAGFSTALLTASSMETTLPLWRLLYLYGD